MERGQQPGRRRGVSEGDGGRFRMGSNARFGLSCSVRPALLSPGLALLAVGLSVAGATAGVHELEGFVLTGESWVYDPGDGGAEIRGILTMPSGNGPAPAVLISHGKGGSAFGFSLPKARVFSGWGMVGIGPDYTHAGTGATTEEEGYSAENSRRANACLTILNSLEEVDPRRIAAYGNSMGAYLTAGLCGETGSPIRAAAITAGGASGTSNLQLASPAVQEVQGIAAPFLMLHGTADTTVPPQQSATLKGVLDSNGIPNRRVLFEGVGHNLHQERSGEVNQHLRDWFMEWGVLQASGSPNPARSARPRGLYVLDSPASTPNPHGQSMRDANMRAHDFVAGYALRLSWDMLEPSPGTYDFRVLDWNLRRLQGMGKKLSLLFMNTDPAWVADTAGVTTGYDAGVGRNRAVPWDPFLLARVEALLSALAAHTVDGVALGQHPVLAVANFGLPGAKLAIRDPDSLRLRDMPGYTRAALSDAIVRNLRAATDRFPDVSIQIGIWPITDTDGSPPLWESIRQVILAEFDGEQRPRVGFWMENLSASRPAPGEGPVSGRPVAAFGAPLHLSQDATWVSFQALTPWAAPFAHHAEAVRHGTPADGLEYAFSVYGSTCFELYVQDVDQAAYGAELRAWGQSLTAGECGLWWAEDAPHGRVLQWDRASARTVILRTTDLARPFQPIAEARNAFRWVLEEDYGISEALFFRVSQED